LNSYKESLIRLSEEVGQEEYRLMNQRILIAEKQKIYYRAAMLIGTLLSLILILLLHTFLNRARFARQRAERNLDEAQEVFRLAMEGANDGIFDWNLTTEKAFYSRQFWGLLGYDPDRFSATMESFFSLVHTDDIAGVR